MNLQSGAPKPVETPAQPEEPTPTPGAVPDDGAAPGDDGAVPQNPSPTEPPPEHPRFKEVYGKMKSYERTLQERERDIEALREHTFKLDQKLREVAEKGNVDAIPEPDPVSDPEAHAKWRQWKNTRQEKIIQENLEKTRIATLIEVESGLRPDYDDMIKVAEREMQLNETKRKEVWGSRNPARSAYLLGKEIMSKREKQEKDEVDRMERVNQGSAEVGTPPATPPPPKAPEVSDDEKRIIRNLFPGMAYKDAEKKYLAQRKAIRGS